jgi:hypothetical protein
MRHYILEEAVKKTGANEVYNKRAKKEERKQIIEGNFVNLLSLLCALAPANDHNLASSRMD